MMQPLSLAKYPYVHGNPVNAIDPSGMVFEIYSTQGLSAANIGLQILEASRPYWIPIIIIGLLGVVLYGNAQSLRNLHPPQVSPTTWVDPPDPQDDCNEFEQFAQQVVQAVATRVANVSSTVGTLAGNSTILRGMMASIGGVPKTYEAHHLISTSIANEYDVMKEAAKLGYNINRSNNGLALPSEVALSQRTGLPYHGGRHVAALYGDEVRARLRDLQNLYDNKTVTNADLIDKIGDIEDSLRERLLSRKIELQKNDPNQQC